jgi:hypothetical protein
MCLHPEKDRLDLDIKCGDVSCSRRASSSDNGDWTKGCETDSQGSSDRVSTYVVCSRVYERRRMEWGSRPAGDAMAEDICLRSSSYERMSSYVVTLLSGLKTL